MVEYEVMVSEEFTGSAKVDFSKYNKQQKDWIINKIQTNGYVTFTDLQLLFEGEITVNVDV